MNNNPPNPGAIAPLPAKPKFSVVVVTYRRPSELRQVLEALARQESPPSFQVIVMDNDFHGTGRPITAPFLGLHPGWRYELSPSNNTSLARNLGAGFAEGEWLAFLDDDCVPAPWWLATAQNVPGSHPGPGLLFGGRYLPKNANFGDAFSDSLEFLPKDKYLLEGNLFVLRSEYLRLDGMRRDLGPSGGRFGYHEGSEFQDRHRRKHGPDHRRVLEPKLAVRHLQANTRSKLFLFFLSGFDAVRAFWVERQRPAGNIVYQICKFPGPLLRLAFFPLERTEEKKRSRIERELYRAGEIVGEISLALSQAGRWLSGRLRLFNNRLFFWHQAPAGSISLPRPEAGLVIPKAESSRGWMAGKVGTTELLALEFSDRWFQPPWPKTASWQRAMRRLFIDSGVFPESRRQFDEFLQIYKKAVGQLDAVCAWQDDPFLGQYEERFLLTHCPRAVRVGLESLSTEILGQISNWRWLVVSPFVETMQRQAARLADIHQNKPWAAGLRGAETRCDFVRCPTFSYLERSPFSSWSEGLEKLTERVLSKSFDVALIGAGAWSLPLAARLKNAGRVAIHLGGETQLVFGIKGQRWEGYGIYNEHWVRPSAAETPAGFLKKELGCYW